jgi:hypothetical protein
MYQIIDNLPIDYEFSTKTKDELKLYGVWFKENKDKRIAYLMEVVKSTQNFENWKADFTLESLKELGKWFSENTETTKISEEEYKIKRAQIPDYIELDDWDLSIKTRSFIVDVGIYFGEVFIKEHKNLKWKQYFSKIKRDINNGHMVISNFGKMELNPILVILSVGWGFARKTKGESSLYDLFKVWENYL